MNVYLRETEAKKQINRADKLHVSDQDAVPKIDQEKFILFLSLAA